MTEHLNTIAVGLMCLACSFCVGLNQILLAPDVVNYPTARRITRVLMFLWASALLYRGADLLLGLGDRHPQALEQSAVTASAVMLACQAAFLYNTLRSRLSARAWRTINRLLHLGHCKPHGSALVVLAGGGTKVWGPGEPPMAAE